MKLKLLGLVLMGLMAAPSFAQTYAVQGGINFTDANTDNGAASNDPELGFQAGLLYYQEVANALNFRTGASVVQRKWSFDAAGFSGDIELLHLEVPLTLQYNANDRFGLFGGFHGGFKLDDSCSSGLAGNSCGDTEELIYGAVGGFHFAFAERFAVDLFYEAGLNDVIGDTSTNRYGLNLLFKF